MIRINTISHKITDELILNTAIQILTASHKPHSQVILDLVNSRFFVAVQSDLLKKRPVYLLQNPLKEPQREAQQVQKMNS